MSKGPGELAADIVVAMIEKGLIAPPNAGGRWDTDTYAEEIAKAYRTIFAATADPDEED